jgi:phenylpyruvate tautomerase PptA (4-oxalocrotonate tautomerase family)
MPYIRLETSLDLPAAKRVALMRAVIACTARELAVPEEACRAAYARIDRADAVIGTGTDEPWAIVHAHMKTGRTPSAKGAFTHALFDLLAAELGTARSALRILITDYQPEDWCNGGDAEPTPR